MTLTYVSVMIICLTPIDAHTDAQGHTHKITVQRSETACTSQNKLLSSDTAPRSYDHWVLLARHLVAITLPCFVWQGSAYPSSCVSLLWEKSLRIWEYSGRPEGKSIYFMNRNSLHPSLLPSSAVATHQMLLFSSAANEHYSVGKWDLRS